MLFSLNDDTDTGRLKDALSVIVLRHAVLRTTFKQDPNGLYPQIGQVCFGDTKCHQQVCSGIDTAGYGFVCTAPLHRHANGFAVRWLWQAKPVRMAFVLSCGAVLCFCVCVAGLTFSNDDEQRGT